jgi:hypothetical protein
MASYTNPADRAAIADAIDLRNLITTESRGAYDSSTQTDNVQHLLLNVAYQGNPTRQSDMAWNLMTRDDGWTKWRELHETRRAIHQSLNEMNPAQRREFIRRYGVSADENQNRGMSDADLFTRGVANLRRDLATMQQSNSRHRTPEATGQFQDMYRWIDDAAR